MKISEQHQTCVVGVCNAAVQEVTALRERFLKNEIQVRAVQKIFEQTQDMMLAEIMARDLVALFDDASSVKSFMADLEARFDHVWSERGNHAFFEQKMQEIAEVDARWIRKEISNEEHHAAQVKWMAELEAHVRANGARP